MHRILLIDDDYQVLQMLQLSLEYEGISASIASSTFLAEELLKTKSFDLVICDLLMPGEGGAEFMARMMLKDLFLPPFLFCSGAPDFQIPQHVSRGVVGLLPKPFTVKELVNTIRMVAPRTRSLSRESGDESGTLSGTAFQSESSSVLFNNLAADKESQPHSRY